MKISPYKQKWHHLLLGFTLISGKSQVPFFSSLGIKHMHEKKLEKMAYF